MTERNYERALLHWEEEIDRKLQGKDERSGKFERDDPCFLRHGITVTIDGMARAIDVIIRCLAVSFPFQMVNPDQ